CLGYHYLWPGNEDAQAKVFAAQLVAAGNVPGMLDAEALAADGSTASLTTAGIRLFLARAAAHGADVRLMYLPRWYWQRMGSPDLSGMPALFGSGYPSSRQAVASELYAAVTPSLWAPYGGLSVQVLQFSDVGQVAGRLVDVDAFVGNRTQFAALLGLAPPSRRTLTEDTTMYLVTPTPPVADPPPAKALWPTQRVLFGFDPAGGWGGQLGLNLHWGFPGGWVLDGKWWVRAPGGAVGDPTKPRSPVQLDFATAGDRERFGGFGWVLFPPPLAESLELLMSAPGGLHIFPTYQH
ncbi:MAG: hypothetical protein ACRDZY_07165, partial [Acidimicrobiales bacterium]